MTSRRDCIDRAARHIDAERIKSLWLYYDDGTQVYWASDDDDMEDLGRRIDRGDQDAYSEWCSATCAEELGADEAAARAKLRRA